MRGICTPESLVNVLTPTNCTNYTVPERELTVVTEYFCSSIKIRE